MSSLILIPTPFHNSIPTLKLQTVRTIRWGKVFLYGGAAAVVVVWSSWNLRTYRRIVFDLGGLIDLLRGGRSLAAATFALDDEEGFLRRVVVVVRGGAEQVDVIIRTAVVGLAVLQVSFLTVCRSRHTDRDGYDTQ